MSKDGEDVQGIEMGMNQADIMHISSLAKSFLDEDEKGRKKLFRPETLEATINNYHDKNAMLFIRNHRKLESAVNDLHSVLSSLTSAVSAASEVREKEAEVYDSLKSIDGSKDKDATVFTHQKQVRELLEQIYEVAEIPKADQDRLQRPDFNNLDARGLETLYRIAEKYTKELSQEEPLEILRGLHALVANRTKTLNELMLAFRNDFVLGFWTKITADVKTWPKLTVNRLDFVPDFDERKRKSFSIDINDHELMKHIYPYWKFIYWLRDNSPDHYSAVYSRYLDVAKSYTDLRLVEELTKVNNILAARCCKSKMSDEEVYYTDEEIGSPGSKEIAGLIEVTLEQIFHVIRVEAVIVNEFWKGDEPNIVEKIISRGLFTKLDTFLRCANKSDPFFSMKAYGICYAERNKSAFVLDKIVNIPKNLWEGFVHMQGKLLKEQKLKAKTTVLHAVREFPEFAVKYAEMSGETERPILEQSLVTMMNDLISWLINFVSPKFSKKKAIRIVVLNIFHLRESLKDNKFWNESVLLKKCLEKTESILKERIGVLLKFIVSKSWVSATAFFDQIVEWKELSGLTDEMVTFQPTHTMEKFNELNGRIELKLKTCVHECYSWLKKKIRHDALRQELRCAIIPFVCDQFDQWNAMAMACYDTPLKVDAKKVDETMTAHA